MRFTIEHIVVQPTFTTSKPDLSFWRTIGRSTMWPSTRPYLPCRCRAFRLLHKSRYQPFSDIWKGQISLRGPSADMMLTLDWYDAKTVPLFYVQASNFHSLSRVSGPLMFLTHLCLVPSPYYQQSWQDQARINARVDLNSLVAATELAMYIQVI